MALALEIAFAAAIGLVALSLLAVVLGKATDRLLLGLTIALAAAAAVAVVALGINLADSYTDVDALLLAAGGIGAAAVAEAGLLALNRGLRRLQQVEHPHLSDDLVGLTLLENVEDRGHGVLQPVLHLRALPTGGRGFVQVRLTLFRGQRRQWHDQTAHGLGWLRGRPQLSQSDCHPATRPTARDVRPLERPRQTLAG